MSFTDKWRCPRSLTRSVDSNFSIGLIEDQRKSRGKQRDGNEGDAYIGIRLTMATPTGVEFDEPCRLGMIDRGEKVLRR